MAALGSFVSPVQQRDRRPGRRVIRWDLAHGRRLEDHAYILPGSKDAGEPDLHFAQAFGIRLACQEPVE